MEGGPFPLELWTRDYIESFGAQAVFGSDAVPVKFLKRITHSMQVTKAYSAYMAASDKIAWAHEHSDLMRLIVEGLKARDDGATSRD